MRPRTASSPWRPGSAILTVRSVSLPIVRPHVLSHVEARLNTDRGERQWTGTNLRAGFHIHSRLRRLDDLGAAPMPISGLPAREWGDVGRQDLGPDRDGGRAVRGT